jgi:transposase
VYDWHKRFSEGREGFDDDPCSGRPSESTNEANVDRVREIVRDEQKENVDQTTEEFVISV